MVVRRATKITDSEFGIRSIAGQAIVEAGVMLCAMVVIFVMLLFVVAESYISANQNYCALRLATNAARRIVAAKWWLGMEDPTYVEPVAGTNSNDPTSTTARQELNAELKAMGMSSAKNFRVSIQEIWLQKKRTTIAKVEFDLDGRVPLLGSKVTLHPVGIASDAEHAITPHGYSLLHAVDRSGMNQHGLRIPVYNVTIGNDMNADISASPENQWFRAGTLANPYPTAYLRLKCSSTGSELSRPHIATGTGQIQYREVRPWGPWDGVRAHIEGP